MTTHPTIPRGWRRLRTGTVIKKGDQYWGGQNFGWCLSGAYMLPVSSDYDIYIRRTTKKKGRK
jgi:hypothetical protein